MEAIEELANALRERLIERARRGDGGADVAAEIAALVEREAAALLGSRASGADRAGACAPRPGSARSSRCSPTPPSTR